MDHTYWLKQSPDKPLFPDILWSRPENKQSSGKLLIIGGNAHGFTSVGEAYATAVEAGIGTVRVLLPDVLKKAVGPLIEGCEFAPSNPSGGFARQALDTLLEQAEWADATLLSGDFGRNSETAVVLEHFVEKHAGPITLTKDAVDYFHSRPLELLNREHTCAVASLGQLQKLAMATSFDRAIKTSLDLMQMVEVLHAFSLKHPAHFMTHQFGTTVVASNGQVSTTKTGQADDVWQTKTASRATVFWLQNTNKPLEALVSSLLKTS